MLSFWLNELKVWYYYWFVHKSEKTRSVATVRKIGVETESMYMPSTWAQRERERERERARGGEGRRQFFGLKTTITS